jgi:glycosyltransferase involved in cell wall biosynthesis
MASSILGGPGKGLVQFLKNSGSDPFFSVIVGYERFPGRESEFRQAFDDIGANIVSIRQKHAFDPLMITQGIAIARRENVNILQSHGYKSHILCAFIHWITGIPWVAFVHGWTDENFKVKCYHVLEKILVAASTQVVSVSESLKNKLPYISRIKTIVIPNAVDPVELDPQSTSLNIRIELCIPKKAKVLGVVGRLSPEKGQIFFLRALQRISSEHPDLVGLLVGEGQERVTLEEEAARLGLVGKVYFVGHKKNVRDYYRAIDVLVIPSLSEGMPNVALEAMLFGIPVVASRVGGVPEVVVEGETGLMVSPGDPDDLANALKQLLSSSERMQRFGVAGRHRVLNHYSPVVRAKRILNLYDQILQKKYEYLLVF